MPEMLLRKLKQPIKSSNKDLKREVMNSNLSKKLLTLQKKISRIKIMLFKKFKNGLTTTRVMLNTRIRKQS